MWRCCCCCCCLVVVTIEKPSQHRSTIQACPKKGKQARADRAGIEPTSPKKQKIEFVRACEIETRFNTKQKHESAVHTTRNARGQKSTPHFVRACAVETHFDIKQEHESAVHTTQNARGQKSTPHFVRACAVDQARARICGKYHAKRSRTEVDTSLCASLRSQNALRHQARALICGTYHAKRSRTEVDTSLCASLLSRSSKSTNLR